MMGGHFKLLPGSKGKDVLGSTFRPLVKIIGTIFGARPTEQRKHEETSAASRWISTANSLPTSSSSQTIGTVVSKDEPVGIVKESNLKSLVEDPVLQRSELPSVAGITDLPNELLIEIFTYVHAWIFCPPSQQALRLWFHVLHTCGRWRSILLSIPEFWRIIPVDRQLHSLSFFLAHRGTLPFDLYLDVEEDAPELAVLMPHIASIRLLDISISHPSIYHPYLDSLLSSQHLSALEELIIFPLRNEDLWPLERAIGIFPMPKLLRLRLRALERYNALSCFPNLRVLELDSCKRWSLSFVELVDALGKCPNLEELYLTDSLFIRWRDYSNTQPQYNGRTLTLPHLHTLHIFDPTAMTISQFLVHLVAPALARLHVNYYHVKPARTFWLDDQNATTSGPSLKELVQVSDTTSQALPSFTADSATATISLSNHVYTVSLRSETRSLSLSRTDGSHTLDYGAALPTAMQDLLELFPAAPITQLSIKVCKTNASSTLWARIFGHMPFLEQLELKGGGSSCEMWGGLYDASTRESMGACCVRLRKIVIHGLPVKKDDAIVSCFAELALARATLTNREAAGVKLEELMWKMYRPSKDESEEEVAAYLAKHIEPLVGRLVHTDMGCPTGSEIDGAFNSLTIRRPRH
ncbi:hypothetical protein C8Q78DRAFT_1049016 [Trametes maxima]|nr:hypothetical protein C8Q78DRAFT_1049016 [Trametes maxima]